MSLTKKVTKEFIYLTYVRENIKDHDRLKNELENSQSVENKDLDVIIDFSKCDTISSSEIGLLVRLANRFRNTSRFLRIIVNQTLNTILESTNLHRLTNLTIFPDKESFVEALKNRINEKIQPGQ